MCLRRRKGVSGCPDRQTDNPPARSAYISLAYATSTFPYSLAVAHLMKTEFVLGWPVPVGPSPDGREKTAMAATLSCAADNSHLLPSARGRATPGAVLAVWHSMPLTRNRGPQDTNDSLCQRKHGKRECKCKSFNGNGRCGSRPWRLLQARERVNGAALHRACASGGRAWTWRG
jgi:hypothetical protein